MQPLIYNSSVRISVMFQETIRNESDKSCTYSRKILKITYEYDNFYTRVYMSFICYITEYITEYTEIYWILSGPIIAMLL